MSFQYNLKLIMDELDIKSEYALHKLSENYITENNIDTKRNFIRTATIKDMTNSKTKRLELDIVHILLDLLNDMAAEKGINKNYTIDSLITYVRDK